MKLVIDEIEQQVAELDEFSLFQVYNAMDCCVTIEVLPAIAKQLPSSLMPIYQFEKALMGPALEMMLRGTRVDLVRREILRQTLHRDLRRVRELCNSYADALNPGSTLNPLSPAQVMRVLYGEMALPKIYKGWGKNKRPTTEREALDQLQHYFYAKPVVRAIIAAREINKMLDVVECKIEGDRFKMSFNIAGTKTGRWSSNKSAFGYGHNAQNITDRVRDMFIPDKGYKFVYLDLDTAESMAVAYKSGDENYKRACKTGDVHAKVTKMIWPTVEDIYSIFYRHWTHREFGKKCGHATNYYGKAFQVAKEMRVSQTMIKTFQEAYFLEFPGIREGHHATAKQLQTKGHITTMMGRRRVFWERRWEDETLKHAIAFDPQSTVADILNIGLYNLWILSHTEDMHCLIQVHDAVLCQYRESEEERLVPLMLKQLLVPVPVEDDIMEIGASAEIGWNWKKHKEDNPDGLIKWTGHDTRKRQDSPEASLLDRRF